MDIGLQIVRSGLKELSGVMLVRVVVPKGVAIFAQYYSLPHFLQVHFEVQEHLLIRKSLQLIVFQHFIEPALEFLDVLERIPRQLSDETLNEHIL